jgi:hypothetical protein
MDKKNKEAWTGGKIISPEGLEKRKKINQKILLFGCLPIVGLFVIFYAIGLTLNGTSEENTKEHNIERISKSTNENNPSKYITGLSPVDVYLNMEKQGFKTEKQLGGEYGNSWTSKHSSAGIDYTVDVFSSNIDNVESVRATAIIDVVNKKIIATQQFFQFVSSLPYENAKPEEATKWVANNFNEDKASTIIGDVKFTIYAPSLAVRMLGMEKVRMEE